MSNYSMYHHDRVERELRILIADLERRVEVLETYLHSRSAHPEYEYETRQGPRKSWDGDHEIMEAEGWELNTALGRVGGKDAGWDRFDYHEETYWRRRRE